jgi:rhodanese-related sulfurtransferase
MTIEIQPADVVAQLRSNPTLRLLDVRQPDEHDLVALPNSTLIPLNELPSRWAEIQAWQDDPVVVYCHHGMRSLRATTFLRQMGFARATSLAGGIDRWSVEVDPSLPRY